jgi:hypothetical protein
VLLEAEPMDFAKIDKSWFFVIFVFNPWPLDSDVAKFTNGVVDGL